jgi:hypothetical protein
MDIKFRNLTRKKHMLPITEKLTSAEFFRHLDDAALGLVLADRCAAGTPHTSVHGRIYSVSDKAKPKAAHFRSVCFLQRLG